MTKPYDPDDEAQKTELVEALKDFFIKTVGEKETPFRIMKIMGYSFRAGWSERSKRECHDQT